MSDNPAPTALGAQVRDMALPDDPHTDAWQLGFCRARKMAADLVDEMMPKIGFAYKGAYIEAEAENARLRSTLRDQFAGQALAALPHIGCGADLDTHDFARAAYQLADAMIAAREQGK